MGVARGWQEGAIASSPCPAEIVGFSNVSEKNSIFLVFFVNSMFLFLSVQLELLRFKLPGFELDTITSGLPYNGNNSPTHSFK